VVPCFAHHIRNSLTLMVQRSPEHLAYFSMPIIVVVVDTTVVIDAVDCFAAIGKHFAAVDYVEDVSHIITIVTSVS